MSKQMKLNSVYFHCAIMLPLTSCLVHLCERNNLPKIAVTRTCKIHDHYFSELAVIPLSDTASVQL